MRPLELALLTVALAAAPGVLALRSSPNALRFVVAIGPGLVAIVQAIVEGPRWQLSPLWLAAMAIPLLVLKQSRSARARHDAAESSGQVEATDPSEGPDSHVPTPRSKRAGVILVLAMGMLAAGLSWSLPVIEPTATTGPYSVGTRMMVLADQSREEAYGPSPGGPRQLRVQIWYPAQVDENATRAPWLLGGKAVTAAAARQAGLPGFALDHLALVDSTAYLDAPISNDGPFPVVVYAHGWSGFRQVQSSQLESLASHGYFVVAADHTYGALVTLLDHGRPALLDPSALPIGVSRQEYDRAAKQLIATFADDLDFALSSILDGTLTAGIATESAGQTGEDGSVAVPNVTDEHRIAMIGHSAGGGAALLSCQRNQRCDAAVAYDPWVEPVPDEIISGRFTRPLLSIGSQEWRELENHVRLRRLHAGATAAETHLTIAGTMHRDLTMVSSLSPLMPLFGKAGSTPHGDTMKIIDQWTVRFLHHHVRERGPDPRELSVLDDRITLESGLASSG